MDKQTIIDNRNAVEHRFNTLRDDIAEREKSLATDREELVRLQGEHRALTALVETPEIVTSKKASK